VVPQLDQEVQFDNGNPAPEHLPSSCRAGRDEFVHPSTRSSAGRIAVRAGVRQRLLLGAADTGLFKINWCRRSLPEAKASVNRDNGLAPLTVNFSSAGSNDPDGNR